MEQQKPRNKKSALDSYAQYSAIAIQMMVIIGLGTYGGYKLDEIYPNQYNIWTIICSLISIVLALYVVIKRVSNNTKNP